jgi:cholesterol transport system auxiliary component
MRRSRLAAAAALLPLALAGCFSLFPKTPPVQLYRFEAQPPAPGAATSPAVAVREGPIDFFPGAAGDAIMTVTGGEVAYVKDARWDVAAEKLFAAAVEHAFEAGGGPVRLVEPGQASQAQDRLTLEVTRFEVDYGAGGAPEIAVSLHATLTRETDLSFVGEQTFDATVPASANRVGPIVEAFDAATTKVVDGLVAWVAQTATR